MAGSRVPAALRNRLEDDATFGLIELLDKERKEWSEQVLSVAADRFERRLTQEISMLRVEFHDDLNGIRQELATTRIETLKWSFVFWVGQVAVMAGLFGILLRLINSGVHP